MQVADWMQVTNYWNAWKWVILHFAQSQDHMCQQTASRSRNRTFVRLKLNTNKFYFVLHLGQKEPLKFGGLMRQHHKHICIKVCTDIAKYI